MLKHDQQFSLPVKDSTGRRSRVFIDVFGGGDYEIEASAHTVLFEWSEQFGPIPMTKNGCSRHLGANHPFWRAVSLWNLQGRRIEGSRAIWHQPRKPIYEKRGRELFVVEYGEEGWDW